MSKMKAKHAVFLSVLRRSTQPLSIAICTLVLAGCSVLPITKAKKQTYSSFDLPSEHRAEDLTRHVSYKLQAVPVAQVLKIYGDVSGRTVIAGSLPDATISLTNPQPLNRIEFLQLLDSVLAQNHIAMVLAGDNAVKAVPAEKAQLENPPEITRPWASLPESSSMMMRTVHMHRQRPSEMVTMLAPYAQLRGSMTPIDSEQVLILRDYAANIRQQLKLLETLDRPD